MSCGNGIDGGSEGESGQTFHALTIEEYTIGYLEGTLTKTSVLERNILDFELQLTLKDNYPLGKNCLLNLEWDNTAFLPSYINVNNGFCLSTKTTDKTATCYVNENIEELGILSIYFQSTLVLKEVPASDADGFVQAYLPVTVNAFGDWDNTK